MPPGLADRREDRSALKEGSLLSYGAIGLPIDLTVSSCLLNLPINQSRLKDGRHWFYFLMILSSSQITLHPSTPSALSHVGTKWRWLRLLESLNTSLKMPGKSKPLSGLEIPLDGLISCLRKQLQWVCPCRFPSNPVCPYTWSYKLTTAPIVCTSSPWPLWVYTNFYRPIFTERLSCYVLTIVVFWSAGLGLKFREAISILWERLAPRSLIRRTRVYWIRTRRLRLDARWQTISLACEPAICLRKCRCPTWPTQGQALLLISRQVDQSRK